MTNNHSLATITELLHDIIALCDAIDSDPEPPTSTRDRIICALDMMRDDAHDIDPDDPTYPYALDESTLDDLTDRLAARLAPDYDLFND